MATKKPRSNGFIWVVLFIGLFAFAFVFSLIKTKNYDACYRQYCDILAQGASVEGKAEFHASNVRLDYEVAGQEYTAQIQMKKKVFQSLYDTDKDNIAQTNIFYSTDDPTIAMIDGSEKSVLESCKQWRSDAWFYGIFLGILVVGSIFVFCVTRSMKTGEDTKKYTKEYPKKEIVDLRTETDKRAERSAYQPLPEPLEGYANDVVKAFDRFPDDDRRREEILRAIGEKMNNNEQQLLVAYRAKHLAAEAYNNGDRNMKEFSTRWLEYAWDGLGGWRN